MTVTTPTRPTTITHVADIPAITPEEISAHAQEAVARLLAVFESLQGDDWQQPTACTEWSVRDILAHQAGSYAGYASWGQFLRQLVLNPYVMQADEPVDGVNKRQLEDRTGHTPEELMAELRSVAEKATRMRAKAPGLLRGVKAIGAPGGNISLGELLDITYTRDTWMHRVDVCEATGRTFQQTAAHDGRIVALIMRDIARVVTPVLGGKTVDIHLTGGEAGGVFRYGPGAQPDATISMDVLLFHKMASRRLQPVDALAQGLVTVEGDRALGEAVVQVAEALY